ncbi:hypothetical protein NFJ02_21g45380 [Pycnococcus provasolii]
MSAKMKMNRKMLLAVAMTVVVLAVAPVTRAQSTASPVPELDEEASQSSSQPLAGFFDAVVRNRRDEEEQSAAGADIVEDDAGLRGEKPPVILDGGYQFVNAIPFMFGGELLGQPVCRMNFNMTCGEYYLSRAKEVCQCDLRPSELPPSDEWSYYKLPEAFGLDDSQTTAKPFEVKNYDIKNQELAWSIIKEYKQSPFANVGDLSPKRDRKTGDVSITLPLGKFTSTDALCRHFFANMTRDVATEFFKTSYPLTGKMPKGKTRGCVVGSRVDDRARQAEGMPWDGKVFTPFEGKMNNLVNIAGFGTETVPGYLGLGRSWLNTSESTMLVQYPIDPYWSGVSQLYTLGTMPGSFPDYRDEIREVPEMPGLFFGRMYVRPFSGPNRPPVGGPYRVYALSFVLMQTQEGLEEWADMLEEGYEPEMGDAVVNAALRNTANILTGQAGEAPIHGQEFPQEKLGYSYKDVESFDSSVTAARDRGAELVRHPDVARLRLADMGRRRAQTEGTRAG